MATGRPSIFTGKRTERKDRIEGAMTPKGLREFRAARKRLAAIASVFQVCGRRWTVNDVSDGDVIEYLVLGDEMTAAYLTEKQKVDL